MKIFAETERLILRELLLTDAEEMFELDSDPEVHRYLGNNPVTTVEQIVHVINFIRQQYIDNGIGRWAVVDKKTNEFVGWAGLKLITEETNSHKNYYDLGYRLKKKYWGLGIATEAAIASLDYAFDKLKTREVYAIANVENIGSNKVLKKLGFKLIEVFDFDGIKCNWYKIEFENSENYLKA